MIDVDLDVGSTFVLTTCHALRNVRAHSVLRVVPRRLAPHAVDLVVIPHDLFPASRRLLGRLVRVPNVDYQRLHLRKYFPFDSKFQYRY